MTQKICAKAKEGTLDLGPETDLTTVSIFQILKLTSLLSQRGCLQAKSPQAFSG